MARKTEVVVTDDFDGGPADGTVRIGLDGTWWELDLNSANQHRVREALRPWLDVARRAPVPRRRPTRNRSDSNAAVRAWARANGHKVSDRGRVPVRLVEAFHEAATKLPGSPATTDPREDEYDGI